VQHEFLQFHSNNISDMPDVNFRFAEFGKACITVDGVQYEAQINAPNTVDNALPPERTIGEMNVAGVDVGVLQSDHVYGELDEYYGTTMRDYPGRFVGLAQVRDGFTL
jgi:hypothetical protein